MYRAYLRPLCQRTPGEAVKPKGTRVRLSANIEGLSNFTSIRSPIVKSFVQHKGWRRPPLPTCFSYCLPLSIIHYFTRPPCRFSYQMSHPFIRAIIFALFHSIPPAFSPTSSQRLRLSFLFRRDRRSILPFSSREIIPRASRI